ncbi:hypothetical protein CoNPh9_CDS0162 [Staphylococcus phage S-CoN_Ph9]|nr:hypothetical protein CoNPh9_CDS0162 [Staphylococcus phage S-CoN_Ph9]
MIIFSSSAIIFTPLYFIKIIKQIICLFQL